MFGNSRKFEEQINTRLSETEARLLARLNALEARVSAVESSLDRRVQEILTRYEQHPDERVRFLLNSVAEDLRMALAKSLEDARQVGELKEVVALLHTQVSSMARGDAAKQARVQAVLNTLYRAPFTGFVSMYFDGGFTPSASLLMGPQSPPQDCVGTISNINKYAGSVVRQGEFWMAKSNSDSVHCIYTPFI